MGVIRWMAFVAGLLLLLMTARSIVSTVIMPRFSRSFISLVAWRAVEKPFFSAVRKLHSYEAKDRLLSGLAPVSVLILLMTWLALIFVSFALMFWPLVANGSFGSALYLSGSSIFTLGIASASQPGPIALEFCGAASGLIVVALQISYLPVIYTAYNRRETLVTALASRAGVPAWGPEVLARHFLSEASATLPALYSSWETLAADITESHSSYPWLMAFRSPNSLNHWVISLLAMLDSAALYVSLSPGQVPAEARQCLRMGYLCLRALAKQLGINVNEDPRPDDPIALPYDRYVRGVEHLRQAGFPIEREMDVAWPDFRGWRVNYEAAAYGLADYLVAVPAPWSGKRSFMTREAAFDVLRNRPRYRTPDDPEGARILETAIEGSLPLVPQKPPQGTLEPAP
jgi:hypothetical protein